MISRANDRCEKSVRAAAAVSVVMLMAFASAHLQAGLIPSSGLVTLEEGGLLRSFTFTGNPVETLQINLQTNLPANLPKDFEDHYQSSSALGVSVLNDRLYVGLVSSSGAFSPKFAEVDPVTGNFIHVFDTATPYLTAFGDDGKNLLLMDPNTLVNNMHALTVYTYTPTAALVGTVQLELPFPGTYQVNAMDGDGTRIYSAYYEQHQPILTNLASGPKVNYTSGPNAGTNYFNTNLDPSEVLRGLAYNPSDNTLWIADVDGFQHYDLAGNLLSQTTMPGGIRFSGLEVIPLRSATPTPEPSTFVLAALGFLCCAGFVMGRRRTQLI